MVGLGYHLTFDLLGSMPLYSLRNEILSQIPEGQERINDSIGLEKVGDETFKKDRPQLAQKTAPSRAKGAEVTSAKDQACE